MLYYTPLEPTFLFTHGHEISRAHHCFSHMLCMERVIEEGGPGFIFVRSLKECVCVLSQHTSSASEH